MRVKLDENMPVALGDALAALGHDAETVAAEGLKGASDPVVWRVAQSEGRFFVTQDLHFSDARVYQPGTHAGILLVRLRNPEWKVILERVCDLFGTADVADWSGCLVVATDHKVRVRREAP